MKTRGDVVHSTPLTGLNEPQSGLNEPVMASHFTFYYA